VVEGAGLQSVEVGGIVVEAHVGHQHEALDVLGVQVADHLVSAGTTGSALLQGLNHRDRLDSIVEGPDLLNTQIPDVGADSVLHVVHTSGEVTDNSITIGNCSTNRSLPTSSRSNGCDLRVAVSAGHADDDNDQGEDDGEQQAGQHSNIRSGKTSRCRRRSADIHLDFLVLNHRGGNGGSIISLVVVIDGSVGVAEVVHELQGAGCRIQQLAEDIGSILVVFGLAVLGHVDDDFLVLVGNHTLDGVGLVCGVRFQVSADTQFINDGQGVVHAGNDVAVSVLLPQVSGEGNNHVVVQLGTREDVLSGTGAVIHENPLGVVLVGSVGHDDGAGNGDVQFDVGGVGGSVGGDVLLISICRETNHGAEPEDSHDDQGHDLDKVVIILGVHRVFPPNTFVFSLSIYLCLDAFRNSPLLGV